MNVFNITLSMVRSYAQACRHLYVYLECHRDEYGLLVVPSRGASPFIKGAYTHGYLEAAGREQPFKPVLRTEIRQLYLPFTADIEDGAAIEPSTIRDFWTRVLAAILRGETSDIALRFYAYLLSASSIPTPPPTDIRFRRDGFLFLDTVVSGRAITDIFTSFEKHGLDNCHFILFIDASGQRLNPAYARKIREMEHAGRVSTILVESIFTEDQGPSVSGIWTITFPALIERLQTMVPELQGEVAAALYFHEVSKRKDGSNLAVTISNGILGSLMYSALDGRDPTIAEYFLEEWKEHVSSSRLQDRATTKAIAVPFMPRFPSVSNIEVSSSHVVRGEIKPEKAEGLIRAFLRGEAYPGR